MSSIRSISVMQQAILSIALGLFSAVIWCAEPLLLIRSSHAFALWLTLMVVTVLCTFLASIWLTYDLRIGIESERWPKEQIERFRTIFGSSFAVSACVLLPIPVVFFDLLSHRHCHGSPFGLLLLLQSFSQ